MFNHPPPPLSHLHPGYILNRLVLTRKSAKCDYFFFNSFPFPDHQKQTHTQMHVCHVIFTWWVWEGILHGGDSEVFDEEESS